MSYKRIIGLDVGDKRIGVAVSDLLRITAQGKETYNRKSEMQDVKYFADMYRDMDAECIVCA